MVWKTGKFGVNNGRTVRSTRTPGKRSEGLLIQTTASSEGSLDQGEVNTITFSLGKQNRWLLPEVIKENSTEVEKDEVVLVESRPDCFSVYNPKSITTRKSKGKFAQANDLLSGIEEIKTRYKVSYPHPSGSWQNEKQWIKQTKQLGAKKKNSLPNWSFEMEFEEVDEPFLSCQEIDEDFSEQFYSSNCDRSPVTLDLGLLLKKSSQKKQKCSAKTKTSQQKKDAEKSKEPPLRKGECIYIESCDEMYDAHYELLAQIQETSDDSDFNETDEWTGGDLWYLPRRGGQRGRRGHGRRRRGRGGWRGRGRGRGGVHHYIPNQTVPSAESETLEPPTKFAELSVEDSYEQFASVDLTCTETNPTFLKEQWGEKYKEAASLPRAFILNVTPDTFQCNGGEIFVLFKADCMTHDTRKVKARVSTVVICNEEGMHESVLAEFISKIKARRTEAGLCSLDEVVNIAKCCFCLLNTGSIADESKPKQPKLSLDVFTKLFGWDFKVLSLKRAQQEVKTYLTNRDKNQPENAQMVVPTSTADQAQKECTICFMEFQPDGKQQCMLKKFMFLLHVIVFKITSGLGSDDYLLPFNYTVYCFQ